MACTLPGVVFLLLLLTVNLAKGVNVTLTPSPVATVKEGNVLWLTCTFDLGGGTLGQLQWRGNDGGIVATVTPTTRTPCAEPVSGYTIDCDNLTSNEVRLGIHSPMNGDTYSCVIYLDDRTQTQIGPAATQVSLIGTSVELTASPSSVIEGTPLTLTCSVTQNSSIYASFNFINGTPIDVVQLSGGSCINGTGQLCDNQCSCTTDGKSFSLTVANVTGDWNNARIRCQINNPAAQISNILAVDVIIPVTSVEIQPPAGLTMDVTEGQTISVSCTTNACRPVAKVLWSIGWINVTSSFVTSVQNVSDDLYITTSTFTFTPSKVLSGQALVCTAFNTETRIQSTRQPILNVRHRPVIVISPTSDPYIIYEGQKNVTLMCTVTSTNPNVSSLVWTRELTQVSNNGLYKLPVITTELGGVYTCSAVNDVGTTSLDITLKVTTLPTTPNIVGFTDVTTSTLTVKWTPNDEGDIANAFNITHECKGCAGAESTSVNMADRGNIYSSKLNNLFPGSEYYVNITAINGAGSSSPLELIVSTPPADSCSSSIKDTSTTSTALLVVGVILVLVAVAVLGVSIFVFRKSRLLSKSEKRKRNDQEPVKFSTVQQSKEGKQEKAEERSHYQELNPRDIQKPNPYSSLSEGSSEAGIETVRGNYESIHGDSTTRHDYIEIREDDDTRRYANT